MDVTALPNELDTLRAALAAALARADDEAAGRLRVEAELAVAKAKASDDAALIAHQQLTIKKLQRELRGPHAERSARLLDQMELTFEEAQATASADELAAELALAKTTAVATPSPIICRASGW